MIGFWGRPASKTAQTTRPHTQSLSISRTALPQFRPNPSCSSFNNPSNWRPSRLARSLLRRRLAVPERQRTCRGRPEVQDFMSPSDFGRLTKPAVANCRAESQRERPTVSHEKRPPGPRPARPFFLARKKGISSESVKEMQDKLNLI